MNIELNRTLYKYKLDIVYVTCFWCNVFACFCLLAWCFCMLLLEGVGFDCVCCLQLFWLEQLQPGKEKNWRPGQASHP